MEGIHLGAAVDGEGDMGMRATARRRLPIQKWGLPSRPKPAAHAPSPVSPA